MRTLSLVDSMSIKNPRQFPLFFDFWVHSASLVFAQCSIIDIGIARMLFGMFDAVDGRSRRDDDRDGWFGFSQAF